MRNGLAVALNIVLICSGVTTGLSHALPTQQALQAQVSNSGSEASPQLTYDVASVRETEPTPPIRQRLSNPSHIGSLDAVMRLSQLVGEALGINFRYQLAGGPDWLDQQNFTIHARADENAERRLASLSDEQAKEEKRHMLLQLLQERFGLTYQLEQRPGLTYFVSVAKETPGLQPGSDPSTAPAFLRVARPPTSTLQDTTQA